MLGSGCNRYENSAVGLRWFFFLYFFLFNTCFCTHMHMGGIRVFVWNYVSYTSESTMCNPSAVFIKNSVDTYPELVCIENLYVSRPAASSSVYSEMLSQKLLRISCSWPLVPRDTGIRVASSTVSSRTS